MAKKPAKKKPTPAVQGAAPALRLEWVAAGQLKANPRNWRRHPESQVAAFRAVLAEVGFVSPVLFNETTGHLIDGHMRASSVPPETVLPVLVGQWSAEQEREILATHNPVAGLAEIDPENTRALLARVQSQSPAIQAMLELLEKQVDDSGVLSRDEDDADDGDEDAGEDGGGGGEKETEIPQTYAIMIRCDDKLDQKTLTKALERDGLAAQAVQA